MSTERRTQIPARVNPVLRHASERRLTLDGRWKFRLDPDDRGLNERWFAKGVILPEHIHVPGCWQGQGFGSDDPIEVWDFRLKARTFRATYTGVGWYGKRFIPPEHWEDARVWLNFGGVHPSAEVWLNGEKVGASDLPFVPFGFEISDLVRFGKENWLAVRVHEHNRILGLSFNYMGDWSGLYRGVELTATGCCHVQSLRILPNVDEEILRLKVNIGVHKTAQAACVLRVSARPVHEEQPVVIQEIPITQPSTECELPVPSPRLWSPDTPNLYRVDATLESEGVVLDALSERVGFVKLSTEGKHFLINGAPYYLRGTGDFLSNPETGCPDTDRDRWRTKLTTLREYGYNYVRCQSFVPTPEYFDVADEVGLIVQSEMGMLGAWGGHSQWHVYAWPQPSPWFRDALKRQWDLVVERDVNHPSASIYCMSNELGASTDFPRTAWECYQDTKSIKPTALVIWTDGGYNPDLPGDFVNDSAARDAECDKPVIQHEFQWWSSFPDVRIMHKYSGAIRPYGAEIAIEAATRHGIVHVLPLAAERSQRLQFVESKAKMEMCRRDNPRLAGICHFTAMDLNPSPQGIIDEFYERKCTDADTWLQTNGDTVVLSSLGFDDRVLAAGDELHCSFSVSDFSHPPLTSPSITWQLVADKREFACGEVRYTHEPYCTCPAGEIIVRIPDIDRPVAASLQAMLQEGNRTFTNKWDLWFFPEKVTLPRGVAVWGEPRHTWLKTVTGLPSILRDCLAGANEIRVVLTERLDPELVYFLREGGCVVLAASEGLVRPFPPKFGFTLGHYFFTPPANYPPYEDGHDGTILLDHPMLGDFPHEGFADLQFFRTITNHPPIDLEPLKLNCGDPVLRVMHSYPACRPLGYLLEACAGKGSLIICALGLDQAWPESCYLLAQMCRYAVAGERGPMLEITDEALQRIVSATQLP